MYSEKSGVLHISKGSRKAALAVGAHPDDIEIGCAGTLMILKDKGYEIFGIIATHGDIGGDKTLRHSEALNSWNVMGFNEKNLIFLDYSDGFVKDDAEAVEKIKTLIKKITPEIVFTMSSGDVHQDHRYICNAVKSACGYKVPRILEFPLNNIDDSNFFVDIKTKRQEKIKAIECHKSQIEKGSVSLESIDLVSKIKAFKCSREYVEGFKVVRYLFS